MDISLQNFREFINGRFAVGGMFHAMILSGTDNEEKRRIVTTIASSILCSGTGYKPCGKCADCRKAAMGIHPDIYTLDLPADKKEIPIDDVRALRADASVIPNDSANKVFIIRNADKMSVAGQNVLLKTLEEPPRFSYFILCAESAGPILPTVRSRCAEVRYVTAEKTAVSDEARENAEKFVTLTVKDDKYALMAHINSLGKMNRQTFAEMASACRRIAVSRLRSESDGLIRRRLIKLSETFDEVSEYLNLNVGIVHVLGYIMAELV